jgi:hypothetical protein
MKALVEGYVITVRKSEDGKKNGFEFLTIGDGAYQKSKVMSIAGDGVKVSMSDKVRIEILEQEYVDKKTGEIRTFWRKTDVAPSPVHVNAGGK